MIEQMTTSVVDMIDTASQGNQMISGVVSLWLLGVLTFFGRHVPTKLWTFCKRHLTTTMTFNNGGHLQQKNMTEFMEWVHPKVNQKMSRTLSISPNWIKSGLALGYGVHFLVWRGRFFWIKKDKIESGGSERQKEEISISTFGRSHDIFSVILEEMTPDETDDQKLNLFQLDKDGDWVSYRRPPKRGFDTIAMDKEIKEQIQHDITHFRGNRDWFYRSGLPYKLTYLLHGKPGGGKTSLIKGVASEFDMNICSLNINSIYSDNILERAFSTVPNNSVIIIEDFDSSDATKNRKLGEKNNNNQPNDPLFDGMGLSMTGILNSLDGIAPLDNCIIFLTTNHIENIDEAIYREGRVDHLLEIKEVDGEAIKKYSEVVFPDVDFSTYTFNEAMGCKLNEALLYSKDDPQKYIQKLKENNVIAEV